MKILLLSDKFWNSLEDKILSVNEDILKALKDMGYKYKQRMKKIEMNGKGFQVISYVLIKGKSPFTAIVHDIVSPHRPYPVYVYIFAIAIYVLTPKMSQREAAKITRQRFGLEKFSASTVCRAIKKLEPKICELSTVFGSVPDELPCGDDGDDLKKSKNQLAAIVLETISPRRPYPIYVYIYAITIYLLIPKMPYREAARIIKRRFGLTKFSTSTVRRVIKKLEPKIHELSAVFGSVPDEPPCGNDGDGAETVLSLLDNAPDENTPDAPAHDIPETNVPARQRLQGVFNTPFLNAFVNKLKNKMPTRSEKNRFTEYISRCCQKYFMLYKQFLI